MEKRSVFFVMSTSLFFLFSQHNVTSFQTHGFFPLSIRLFNNRRAWITQIFFFYNGICRPQSLWVHAILFGSKEKTQTSKGFRYPANFVSQLFKFMTTYFWFVRLNPVGYRGRHVWVLFLPCFCFVFCFAFWLFHGCFCLVRISIWIQCFLLDVCYCWPRPSCLWEAFVFCARWYKLFFWYTCMSFFVLTFCVPIFVIFVGNCREEKRCKGAGDAR